MMENSGPWIKEMGMPKEGENGYMVEYKLWMKHMDIGEGP